MERAINGFAWERSFANLDINDKVYLFNETIKNILSNFIPHETITFDDRDPPWINSQVKHLINEKNVMYKNYLKNKSNQSFETFQSFQSQLSSLIANLKIILFKGSKKILDLSTSPQTYWSILKNIQIIKRYRLLRQFFMIINLLQILNKKLKSLILTFLNNVHLQLTANSIRMFTKIKPTLTFYYFRNK